MADQVAMRFVGVEGQWLPGIPARDLTADEVAQCPEVKSSPLYVPVTSREDHEEPKPLPQGEFLPEPEDEETGHE